MSIEEAEYILNEVVIEEPSVSSYTYISAEKINKAIDKILEEKLSNEMKIKELEENLIQEKNKLEKIIIEKEIKKDNYPIKIYVNRGINIKRIIKYLKKLYKHFLKLEFRS